MQLLCGAGAKDVKVFSREPTRKILLNEIKRTRFGDKNRREYSPLDDKNRTGFLRCYGRKNEKPGQFFAPTFGNSRWIFGSI